MTALSRVTAVLVGVGLVACQDAAAPRAGSAVTHAVRPAFDANASGTGGDQAGITGGGHYSLAGLDVQFSVSAIRPPGGTVAGAFHHFADEGAGLIIDFHGAVTCLAVDPVNHRGWIGGVVTQNNSTDPDFLTAIQQPGRDIWFRVLDGGQGGEGDRTTFTGFQGSAGIQTSAEYCPARLWPANNARTWPVTAGNISVRP